MPPVATMRAAFFESTGALDVREARVPEPRPNEALLRVRYCGICGSDLSLFKTGALAGPGVILGHEVSAVVEMDATGTWAAGERITYYPPGAGCGECVWCREGKPRYCTNPPESRHGGGYAQYMTIPAANLIAIPDEVDDRSAAMAEPLGVAIRGIEMSGVAAGDFVYVQGLGPIGLFAVAGLAAAGCRVVGADPRGDRRELALDQGAEDTFDPTREDPFGAVLRFDPRGPRAAFECSGAVGALQQVIDCCGPGGTVAILGIPMTSVFLLRMTLRELRAFAIQGPSMDSMRSALQLLADRRQVARIATGTAALDQATAAFQALVDGGGGAKVLVDPWA
jgi:threonine dehydrogenase-like Zn-dependent dehydrogenase